jgi:hypothetical protein
MFIFVGWWALAILLLPGPLVWLFGLFLKGKKLCPSCREAIDEDATRYPSCTSEVGA